MKAKISLIVLVALAGCVANPGLPNAEHQSDPVHVDPSYPPALVELGFDSHTDRLNGILYQANGSGPHPTVVMLHGYPGNEKNLDLAQSLRRTGFNVLFFHYRGAWGSEGDFSFTHVVEDVGSAVDYLRTNADGLRVDTSRLMLIGHSMGGFAALQGSGRDELINCVAAIAPADVGYIAGLVEANADVAKAFSSGADALGMLNGWSGQKVLAELGGNRDSFSLIDLAPKLNGKSVLLIAAEKDTALAPEVFHTPLVAAYDKQPNIALKHYVLPGDHAFSWSRLRLIETVINWAKECE